MVHSVLSVTLLMMMLNNPCSTPLINDHQPDASHSLSPEFQLLFSPPSSLFLQPIFLQLPNENTEGDGHKIINKVKVCCIHGSHLFHTDSHTVVEGNPCWLYPITFLPITCLWKGCMKTHAMIFSGIKVKLAGLHTGKFPGLSLFLFLRTYC